MKLKITAVNNDGDETKEYVLFEATEDCEINRYAIYDATYASSGRINNKQRHFYRFPPKTVAAGDLVSLRTSKGKDTVITNNAGKTVHRFYWGLDHPVWNDTGDKAVLIELSDWKATDVDG